MWLFVFVAMLLSAQPLTAFEEKEIVTITQGEQTHEFRVDVARTREQLEKGLMFVESMPANEGMIFLYNPAQPVKFWMKNTLIPLDMLFFDDQNILAHIEHNAQPHDLTHRGAADDILICSVIELNGGTAAQIGLQPGARLSINFEHECLQSSVK